MRSSIYNFLPVEDGVYRSPAYRPSWPARCFPSLVFYLKYARIVWRSSRLAKRGEYGDREWGESSLDILHALESVGVQFEIAGLDHLDQLDGPFVVAGNHMSTLETMVLPCILLPYSRTTFVVKQSLLDYPLFKHVMRSRHPIAVSQNDPRGDLKRVLEQGLDRLREGAAVMIFPEGARRRAFEPRRFNSMGVKLAQRGQVPLVPLALKTDAWSLGRPVADLGRIDPSRTVHFSFGSPLEIGQRKADAHEATIDFIQTHMQQWRNASPAI